MTGEIETRQNTPSAVAYARWFGKRAREIAPEDFAKFDLILVMDWENLTDLQHRSPPQFKHKIHLLMRYANDYDAAVVPDPYYGLNEGFNQVLDYCTDACGGLLETLERKARMMQKSLQATKAAG